MYVKTKKMRKSIGLILTLALVISMISSFGMTASAGETAQGYKSSDYFSTESVSNGPWTNQFYDFITAGGNDYVKGYTDMVATKERGELEGTPTVWQNSTAKEPYSWGNNAAFVGAKYMRASTATGDSVVNSWWESNTTEPGRNYPVKTFTAPEAGSVTIKSATNLTITGAGTHIRIMKISEGAEKSTQVWPSTGWHFVSAEYVFEPFSVAISEGEKLTFECAYLNDGTNTSTAATVLSWDPVVEYPNAYKASEYFSTASSSNGPWSNQFYDYDGTGTEASKYVDMAYLKGDGTYGNIWINHDPTTKADDTYPWGNNSPMVGETVMMADTTNSGNYTTAEKWGGIGRDYPVKTFTAPRSGFVKITAATVLTATKKGTDIRIMKIASGSDTPTLVWPVEGWKHVSGEYTFADKVVIPVNAGDKITFENAYKYSSSLSNTAYDTELDWDPYVEYVDLNGIYASSTYFNGINPNAPWSWQYYDVMSEGKGLGDGGIGLVSSYVDMIAGKVIDGNSVWLSTATTSAGDYSWGDRAAYVGANVMRTATSETNWVTYNSSFENLGWVGRNYPVKTFTAPKSGVIKISAATALTATANGTDIRITKFKTTDTNPTNVWPKANNSWQHISGSYTFSDIEIEVEAGDKIAFENAYIKDAALGNTAADTVLYWDPVVEYANLPYVSSIEFTNASGTKLNSFAEIVAAGTVNVTAVLGCAGLNGIEEATVVVAVYDESGCLKSAGLSDAKGIAGDNTEAFTIDIDNIPNITDGKIKVFIFDNMASLTPLSDIGNRDYISID